MNKFVIARKVNNEAGYPEFEFSQRSYVHSTLHHAEQEARRMARRTEETYAVFEKVSEASCDIESVMPFVVDSEVLAARLASLLQERGLAHGINDARKLVYKALTTIETSNKD